MEKDVAICSGCGYGTRDWETVAMTIDGQLMRSAKLCRRCRDEAWSFFQHFITPRVAV